MARKDVGKYVDLTIFNSQEMADLFDELKTTVQNQVIYAGLKRAAKIIKDEIKSEYSDIDKHTSKSNGQHFKNALRDEDIKSNRLNDVGLKIGFGGLWAYKFRWPNSGTVNRYRRSSKKSGWKVKRSTQSSSTKFTGKIVATHFFDQAVYRTQDQAQAEIANTVNASMEKTVNKYNK